MAYIATPELLVKNKDFGGSKPFAKVERNKPGDFDEEIESNPILENFCYYLELESNLLEFINARIDDDSNTLLLALKKKKFIQSIALQYFIKINNDEAVSKSKQTYFDFINDLIKNRADVNACDNSGITPLMQAIENDDPEIVELIVKAGADMAPKRKDQKSALDIAREKKNDKIIKLLLESKK